MVDGPVWPKRLETAETRWAKGEPALGLRPLAVGRYVLRHLSDRDIRSLRRAMKKADGRDENDDWYCVLGNIGFGPPQEQGQPVTQEHMALMLEYIGMARVHPQTTPASWHRILCGAFGQSYVYSVACIYARAMGLEDSVIFHNLIGDEMRARLRAQRQVLIDSGFEAPVAYARPALHRYPPDAPELREPEQMALFGGIEGAAREGGEGEG